MMKRFWLVVLLCGVSLAPAVAQVPTGTPIYAVNAKWVTDHGSQVYNTLAYAQGSDCGISEAYAAMPSTGGVIWLGGDCAISGAQTLTKVAGKLLRLDLGGKTLSISAGGLSLIFGAGYARSETTTIENGTIAFTGSTATTGLYINGSVLGIQNLTIRNVTFVNFSVAGSIALLMNGTEDWHIEGCNFQNNYTHLKLTNSSNEGTVAESWFQEAPTGAQPIILQDSGSITFMGGLIQGNGGTYATQIIAATSPVSEIRFLGVHVESNGDGTANSRQFLFNAASGQYIIDVGILAGVWNDTNPYGNLGMLMGFTGAGSFYAPFYLEHFLVNGVGGVMDTPVIGDNIFESDNSGAGSHTNNYYAVGVNNTNSTYALDFNPGGANAKHYSMGEDPSTGYLHIFDQTDSKDTYFQPSGWWTVPAGINVPSLSVSAGIYFTTNGGHFNTNSSTNDLAGASACSTSTKAITFTTPFTSTPVIVVSDEAVTGGARVSAKSHSGFTVTCTGASDSFDWIAVGNPN
jgi:hypothetical protein